jgi:hypothetical protein
VGTNSSLTVGLTIIDGEGSWNQSRLGGTRNERIYYVDEKSISKNRNKKQYILVVVSVPILPNDLMVIIL